MANLSASVPGLILSMLVHAAPIEGQSRATAPACYDLELGPWKPFIELEADSIYIAPPPRIFLDTVSGVGLRRSMGHSLTAAPGAIPSIHRFSWWTPVAPDSIELVWTTGFSGLRVKFATTSPLLTGIAETFWDFGRAEQQASATATLVSCDAQLPDAFVFRHRLPRGLGMAAADSILVGEPLRRSSLRLEHDSERSIIVHSVPDEPFQNALDLRVLLGDGGEVRQIRFSLPEEVSHDEVVMAMRSHYGDPTSQSRVEPRPARFSYLTLWTDRLIRIGVSGGAEGSQSVIFSDPRGR